MVLRLRVLWIEAAGYREQRSTPLWYRTYVDFVGFVGVQDLIQGFGGGSCALKSSV